MAPPSIIEGPDSPAVNGDKVFKPLEERPSKKAKTEAKGEFLLRIIQQNSHGSRELFLS